MPASHSDKDAPPYGASCDRRAGLTRREFCTALAAGGIAIAAAGVAGCSPFAMSDEIGLSDAQGSPDEAPSRPRGVIVNTDTTLVLPSDLSLSGLHPSFIDFQTEHNISTWGGYRYWLAWTPYTDFTTEFPTLAASNNLIDWVKPLGLPNPITRSALNGEGAFARLNDPEICYDPSADCINLYHGVYNAGSLIRSRADNARLDGGLFRYRIFSDGTIKGRLFEKGAPFTSLSVPGLAGGSVTVHRELSGLWHMWQAGISHRTSRDGFRWSKPKKCTVGTPNAYRSTELPSYMKGWRFNHIGGKYNPANGRVEFAVSCTPPGGVGGAGEQLAMVACDLADPTTMYVMLDRWLLTTRTPGDDWDGGSTYRSVIMPDPDDARRRRLIYSAFEQPCDAQYAKANHISTVVDGDISGSLLADRLPKA